MANQMNTYSFPMIDIPDTELKIFRPMSRENFELLKRHLSTFLTQAERAIVSEPVRKDDNALGQIVDKASRA
jgi:hypothetical protein